MDFCVVVQAALTAHYGLLRTGFESIEEELNDAQSLLTSITSRLEDREKQMMILQSELEEELGTATEDELDA